MTPLRGGIDKPTNLNVVHEHKITDDDFGTTTLASSSRNEIYSNGMSWRNKQIAP